MAETAEETAREVYEGDEQIIEIAKARFQRCQDWESTARSRWLEDRKFATADPDNGYQWPGHLWNQRKDDPNGYKPRLTVNKTKIHNLQITNDMRMNKPGVKISPVGDNATFEAAKLWMGLVRHIERISKATQAYDTAAEHQVQAGLGFLRVETDYIDGTFDQELFIRRVKNPLNVFLDPDHNELDGSDANFGFVFNDTPRTQFFEENQELKGKIGELAFGNTPTWVTQDYIREAEYFTRLMKKDTLLLLRNPEDGQLVMARWSRIPGPIREQIRAQPKNILKRRPMLDQRVMWYKIAGNVIVDRNEWPGRYIPLVPVIGEEVVIENRMDRKGHTRGMKDAQRMYNFWTSNATEFVALQTKSKWFVPVGATDNLDGYYRTINVQNYPYIPWRAYDAEGNQLPAPIPIEPPTMAEAYVKGMLVAREELMMSSGQREENFGQPTNAISGKAIARREKQGDRSTFHFIDGLAVAIRQVGNIILDTAPRIYTNKQIKQILAEDGTEQLITVDPSADAAYAERKVGDKVEIIFNPKVGRYWVDSDVGPSFATRRQEAWDAFVQITTQNKEIVTLIGDLMFLNADFPGADEIAARLKRLVPPNVLGQGPEPALLEAQQNNEKLKVLLTELTEKLAAQDLQLKDKQDQREINKMDADTRRLKELGNAESDLSEETLRPLIEKLVRDILNPKNDPVIGDARRDDEGASPTRSPEGGEEEWRGDVVVAPEGAEPVETTPEPQDGVSGGEEPPVPGARQAPDGLWYVETQPGQYSRVESTQ